MVRRLPAVLLLLVALVTAVSHVCAQPTHGHADVHHDHGAPAPVSAGGGGHHHSDADAAHIASCDAIGARAVSLLPAMPTTVVASPRFEEAVGASGRTATAPMRPSGVSPPLFLLHAALLI
jgi:hypothetical protein